MLGIDSLLIAMMILGVCVVAWDLLAASICVGLYYQQNRLFCSNSRLTILLVIVLVALAIIVCPILIMCYRVARRFVSATRAKVAENIASIQELWNKRRDFSVRGTLEMFPMSKAFRMLPFLVLLIASSPLVAEAWSFIRPYVLFVFHGEEQHFKETMFGWMPREIAELKAQGTPPFVIRQMWDPMSHTFRERLTFIMPTFVENLQEAVKFTRVQSTSRSHWEASVPLMSIRHSDGIAILTACVVSTVLLCVVMVLLLTSRQHNGHKVYATTMDDQIHDTTTSSFLEFSETSTIVGDGSGVYKLDLSKLDIDRLKLSGLSHWDSLIALLSSWPSHARTLIVAFYEANAKHSLPSFIVPRLNQQDLDLLVQEGACVFAKKSSWEAFVRGHWHSPIIHRFIKSVSGLLGTVFSYLSYELYKFSLSVTGVPSRLFAKLFGDCVQSATNPVHGFYLGIQMAAILFADRHICPTLESWVESISNRALEYRLKTEDASQMEKVEYRTVMLPTKGDDRHPTQMCIQSFERQSLPPREERKVRFAANTFGAEFEKDDPPCQLLPAGYHDPFNAAARRSDLRFSFKMPTTFEEMDEKRLVLPQHVGFKAIDIDYRVNFRRYDLESLSNRFKYFLGLCYRRSCGLRVDTLRHQTAPVELNVAFRTFPTHAPKRSSLQPNQVAVTLEGFGWLRNELTGANHANATLCLNQILAYAHDLWAKSETEKRLAEGEYEADTWVEDFMKIDNDVGAPFIIRRVRQLGGGTGEVGFDKNSKPTNYFYEIRW